MTESDTNGMHRLDAGPSVLAALADRVRSVVAAGNAGAAGVQRVSVPVAGGVPLLEWIRDQQQEEALYWSGRDDDVRVAAVGAADVIRTDEVPVEYDDLRDRLAGRLSGAPPASRYYGGLRFDAPQARLPNGPDRSWAAFGTYRFVLPRFEMIREAGDITLACNLVMPRDAEHADALLAAIQALSFPEAERSRSLPVPIGRADTPNRTGWTRMVRWALDAIGESRLDKVVLARKVALTLGQSLDPFRVLRHLESTAPRCFHFAIRPAEGPAFVGASPERLFRRQGRTVQSEAVAGTRPRGETPESDAALREELLRSSKERREHAFVQRAVQDALDGLCRSVETPDAPTDLALARSRHLHAPVTGTLRPDASTVDLIEALHPTPAVGGVPTDAALTAIRTQEPFDRGWYAGPVGWVGPGAAEVAVAIRSGLVQGRRLTLFSGAGIVEGSVSEREWEEIEQKLGDFTAIMGLNGREMDSHPHGTCR